MPLPRTVDAQMGIPKNGSGVIHLGGHAMLLMKKENKKPGRVKSVAGMSSHQPACRQ
jgi:hypothetical protein